MSTFDHPSRPGVRVVWDDVADKQVLVDVYRRRIDELRARNPRGFDQAAEDAKIPMVVRDWEA